MSEFRYHIRKCFPLVSIYLFGLFVMLWFAQSQLQAGETMFKDCNKCGHLNYQFTNTCSLCGEQNNFTDTYFKPDCEKRDAKKKKAKGLTEDIDRNCYNEFIMPINKVLKRIIHCREFYSDGVNNLETQGWIEELDAAFDSLVRAREILIDVHDLEEHRMSRKSDEPKYIR